MLLSSKVGWSADYQKPLRAYKNSDYATALRELKPLAEEGHAEAQFWLGKMYNRGDGVPQNYKTALKWWTRAAEQGLAEHQYNLGWRIFFNGRGLPKNDKTAFKWFTRAAEQGHFGAQYKLGWMYHNGRGVPQDYVYAHMWYNVCASQGSEDPSAVDEFKIGEDLQKLLKSLRLSSKRRSYIAVGNRDRVAEKMSPSQIEKAQDLASECVEKKFKECD